MFFVSSAGESEVVSSPRHLTVEGWLSSLEEESAGTVQKSGQAVLVESDSGWGFPGSQVSFSNNSPPLEDSVAACQTCSLRTAEVFYPPSL